MVQPISLNHKPSEVPVSQIERELLLEISSGSQDAVTWLFQFRILWVNARQLPYIESLKWLVSHKIVGNRFLEFMEIECERSPTRAMAWLRKKVYSDFKLRKVYAK